MTHGSITAYGRGCRCDLCRQAQRRYDKQRAVKRRRGEQITYDSRQVVRDAMHGLQALGWPAHRVPARMRALAYSRSPKVRTDLLHQFLTDAEKLACRPGPSQRSRAVAAGKGWTPDLLWDVLDGRPAATGDAVDPIAVSLAREGVPVALTRAERLAAVAVMRDGGMPSHEIARRLGVAVRTIERDRVIA